MSHTRLFSAPFLPITICAIAATGCAPKLASFPTGPGAPAADYAAAYAEATDQCRGVRTMQATLNMSGRTGATPVRGRIDAGFAAPGQVRLEGLPPVPFGRPIFILVGRPNDATLVLPRDKRVLTEASTEAVVEALTGVALSADELRAVVSGCGLGAIEPSGGRAYDHGWMAVDSGRTTTWLRNVNGTWRASATVRQPLEIRYEEVAANHPARIRIRTIASASGTPSDITLRVADVDINVPLGPEVFRTDVPDDAVPMTLEELRRSLPRTRDRDPGTGNPDVER